MTAPERIWIDAWGGKWSHVSGGTQEIEYTRTDLIPAMIAEANAEKEKWKRKYEMECDRSNRIAWQRREIKRLQVLADARLALLAEAEERGRKAEREACAKVAMDYRVPIGFGCTKAAVEVAAAIRARGEA